MSALVSLVRLLLPRRCVSCRRPGDWMCDDCGPHMRALAAPLCARCGAPTAVAVAACRACARLRWLTTARSALWLDGPVLDVVARWKRGEISPGRLAAALVAHELPRPPVDAIAVVPAVRDRLLLRGADPPKELAAELGRWWGLPIVPLISRTRAVRPQRGLAAPARRRNVRGAFSARAGPPALALVDDVYTTGATVDECARALRQAGAEQVHVITFARTPPDRTFARAPPHGRLHLRRTRARRHAMQLQVSGRNLDITEPIREYALRKLARIERHLTEDTRVDLELAIERNRSISSNQCAELTVWTRGPVLRAHESAEDMYAAIDLAVDKLDRQVRRYRERRRHWRPHHQARDVEALLPLSDADEAASVEAETNGSEPELPIPTIVKTKRFNMKPMDPDEAALQLELVGHEFYVFLNAESDAVAVIYRRRDGNLGVIEPIHG